MPNGIWTQAARKPVGNDPAGIRQALARHLASAAWAWLLAAWMAATLAGGPHFQPKARWLAEAVALLGCGLLLYPGWNDGEILNSTALARLGGLAGWCALLATGLLAHGLVAEAPAVPLLKLASGVFLLGLLAHSAVSVWCAPSPENPTAPCLAVCIFAMLCAIPVWLGPWMEWLAYSHPSWFQAVLWVCPPAYLAALLDYDVLREQWFYEHTPFGMLRYDYPDGGWASLMLAGAAALLPLRRRVGARLLN